jgi:hypothetical protein
MWNMIHEVKGSSDGKDLFAKGEFFLNKSHLRTKRLFDVTKSTPYSHLAPKRLEGDDEKPRSRQYCGKAIM